jgi:hypothetical protein
VAGEPHDRCRHFDIEPVALSSEFHFSA